MFKQATSCKKFFIYAPLLGKGRNPEYHANFSNVHTHEVTRTLLERAETNHRVRIAVCFKNVNKLLAEFAYQLNHVKIETAIERLLHR